MHHVSAIITYRGGSDPVRRANLDTVLRWLARRPEFEVVVVEQDAAPNLDAPLAHPKARLLFAYNPGPFNKGWGYNVGVRAASCAWYAFCDADVVAGTALDAALGYLNAGCHAIKPYRRLIDLDAQESEFVRAGDYDWLPPPDPGRPLDREGIGERIVFAGGLFLIARPAYASIGGWDERFRGWGGEDDAMTYKLERARVPALELDTRPALHLHHARRPEHTYGQPYYAANCGLLDDYRRYTDEQLVRLAEVQMQQNGRREKYRPAA